MKVFIASLIALCSVNSFAAQGNFDLNLKDKTLTSQISIFSKIYNKPVIIDSKVISKKMTINAIDINREDAKNVISKALSLSGIAVIETPKDVSFLEARVAIKSGIEVFKNKVEKPQPERMATLILDLPKDLSAPKMEQSLRSLYSRDGDMKANDQSNQLIITDWTSNLVRFQDMISKSSQSK